MSDQDVNVTSHSDPHNKTLHHDLQAQLVNVRGFCGEIERTASELEKIAQCDTRLEAECSGDFGKLINNDLLPCIKFLALSTEKLDSLVVELSDCTPNIEKRA